MIGACLVALSALGDRASGQALRGTLVVAVPVRDGIVVCSDKRLYNTETATFTDDNIKIRKISDNALFAATNTVGFFDKRSRTMGFDAFKVTAEYASTHDLTTGNAFWIGLKAHIRDELLKYFQSRPPAEWPSSDRTNNNLLFNLIFYSLRDGRALSHSVRVLYEKARTPIINVLDPLAEEVRTPKLSGKGREVMSLFAREPRLARDPAILNFDESRFDAANKSAEDAVAFADKLFRLTNAAVPRARVSAESDCAILSYQKGFGWLKGGEK